MKRKVFSSFIFAALLGMGMVGITACADYDSDINNLQVQVTENTKLTEALQSRVNTMEGQIKNLQEALDAIKSCQCGDVDAKIADAISKALSGLNYTTPEDVAAAMGIKVDNLYVVKKRAMSALTDVIFKENPETAILLKAFEIDTDDVNAFLSGNNVE